MSEQPSLIPMRAGETLRFLRESRQLSVAAVANHLKCPEPVIYALEADAAARLPATYRRGYLRAYGRLLGLEGKEIDRLLQEVDVIDPELRPVFPGNGSARNPDRWLSASSYLLASLLVGTLAWQVSQEVMRLTRLQPDEVTQATGPDAAAVPQRTGHVNASIATLEELRRETAPAGSRTGAAGLHAWAALEQARNAEPVLREGEHWLELSTSADSWVEITGHDGSLLEQDLVRGGESRRYRGFGPFRITLGRSSAVNLALDGTPIELAAASASDDVVHMTLEP